MKLNSIQGRGSAHSECVAAKNQLESNVFLTMHTFERKNTVLQEDRDKVNSKC